MKSRQSTPNRSAKKTMKQCDDFESEFCKRALSLLTCNYEQQNISDYYSFPPVKITKEQVQEKKHTFNSTVTDLRVKRAFEQQFSNNTTVLEDFEKQISQIENDLSSSTVNLDDIFTQGQVERPQTPLYITNEEKDAEAERQRITTHSACIDIAKIERTMKSKLELSEARGRERARLRLGKASNLGPESPVSPRAGRADWNASVKGNFRNKYLPEGGYPVYRNAQKTTKESYYPKE